MKKSIVSTALATVMLMTPLTAMATTTGAVPLQKTWTTETGIDITVVTDHELTKEEMASFNSTTAEVTNSHANAMGSTANVWGIATPQPLPLPNGEDSQVLSGPEYRTYDNTLTYTVLNIVLTAINTILTKKISNTTVAAISGAATNTFIRNITSSTALTYWGFWTTKSYSSYYGVYKVYDTQVKYSTPYSGPTAVYYYDTGVDASGL